jgi:putative glycerol-1-phosphate prenyltransferase
LAGKFKGNKLTYYEAGSGAIKSIPYSIIINCIKNTSLPIIVGGGINSTKKINLLKKIGVNIIVVGNHVEKNPDFLKEIS